MVDHARLLLHQPPSGKDSKVGNSTHLVASGQLRIALRIDLQHNGPSCHVYSGTLHFGSCHAARPAPGRPEVDQHGNAGLANDFVELLRIDFQRLVYRRYRSLARAAAAGISQMFGGYPVLSSTDVAGSNGHRITSSKPARILLRVAIPGLRSGSEPTFIPPSWSATVCGTCSLGVVLTPLAAAFSRVVMGKMNSNAPARTASIRIPVLFWNIWTNSVCAQRV